MVGVNRAPVVACDVELDFYESHNRKSVMPTSQAVLLLVLWLLTTREEPVGVLDNGLDDADDLQGDCGHHLCDVAAADKSFNLLAWKNNILTLL